MYEINPDFALLCPICNNPPNMEQTDFSQLWSVWCSDCYDADCVGDPPRYVSNSLVATSRTLEDAIEDWNDLIDDYNAEHNKEKP